MFRERLVQVISAEPDMFVVGEADCAAAAKRMVAQSVPNLLLIDIALPDESGLILTKSLREQNVTAPVLILSMHAESNYAGRAIRAGANGYITKSRAASEVLTAIRTVLSGAIYFSDAAIESARSESNGSRWGFARPANGLTEREIDVLCLLGEGLTTREIAERLNLGVASIDTYRARIKEKMKLRNGVELQHFATLWLAERR